MNFISLFAGIGGMDLGLERAGMTCVAQVEIDDYATRVLAKHWPDVPRFRDVRDVGSHNLPAANLICGGFPCQDISDAGQRKGIQGERSGLWSEYARIISEIRPGYVLVENVAALLDRGMGRVLGDLASIGYDAEWEIVSACSLGATHTRERVFIVAYPSSKRGNGRGIGIQSATSYGRRVFQPITPPRLIQTPLWDADAFRIRRRPSRLSSRLDRLRGLGNAVVPQVAEYIGRQIMEAI